MEAIKAAFVPHRVKYGPESVDWKNSCYMEVRWGPCLDTACVHAGSKAILCRRGGVPLSSSPQHAR